ncbi:uncharacterized protein [Venturia canescens]|uniref:uncharacterized protein isoform X2 n=1 Tax=Venturia canescens TaxID=32260 RepID=UPI001C9C2EBE|nr:uncharacterized protein LOC122409986 isoform X2 [Venturia canescens]
MAQTVKSTLRMSMAMRNLGTSMKSTLGKGSSRMAVYSSSSNKAKLHLPDEPAPVFERSTSLQWSLENSRTSAQLLSLVEANQRIMTMTDVFIALRKLVYISKISANEFEQVYEDARFLILCEVLKKNRKYLNGMNSVNALKAILHFKVPVTSIIVEMILKVVQQDLNLLSLDNLSFLHFLLRRCHNSPIVEELKVALPRVYENNLSTNLDRDNIWRIRNAIAYLVKKSSNSETFNILIDSAMKCKQPIDPYSAAGFLWAFCSLQCPSHNLPKALNHVQNILAENITHIEPVVILELVRKVWVKMKEGEQYYYHEGFIDACASTAISQNWGLATTLCLLSRLNLITHTHIPLLDHIAEKLFKNGTLSEEYSVMEITSFVCGCAIAEYKPVPLDLVEELVTSDRVPQLIYNQSPLLKLSVSLLALDVYCPELIKKTFEECNGINTLKGRRKAKVLFLYQAIKTLYPQYSGPWPCDDIAEFGLRYEFLDFPLRASLEAAVGGSTYVISNIRSTLGHIIDHAIVMRKGGYPVAINEAKIKNGENSVIQLKDIEPPAGSQVILILYLPQHAYSINTQKMMGPRTLQMKSLETLTGYTVVPIQSTIWTSLPASQRIPYLMQTIKLKCDERFDAGL